MFVHGLSSPPPFPSLSLLFFFLAFARQTFHRITQNPGETIQEFVTRLRKAAKDCDFGSDNDSQIRDAVLNKCTSTYIKRKLLEEGQELNLLRLLPSGLQANGEVERQNRSLLKRLQIAQAENKQWRTELRKYLTAYRSIPIIRREGVPLSYCLTGKSRGRFLI